MADFQEKVRLAGDALKNRRGALRRIMAACFGLSGASAQAAQRQASGLQPSHTQSGSTSMQPVSDLSPDDRVIVTRSSLAYTEIRHLAEFVLAQGPIQGYASLREYGGPLTRLLVFQHAAGERDLDAAYYWLDPTDVSSRDNGGTVLVSKSGKRWKRVFEGDIHARWFGARGDGTTDDGDAINRAVAFAGSLYASTGRTQCVVLDNGTFYLAAARGTLAIPCHDDGTVKQGKGRRLPSEPAMRQPYCVGVWPGVKLYGHNAVVKGNYRYGMADASQPVTFGLLDQFDTAMDAGLENLTCVDCFMAFGALSATLAGCIFDRLHFVGCGVGIYAAVLEQCTFSNIEALRTGVPVLVGGQWVDRNDDYNERGGFADKCTVINVRNIYDRVYGDDERKIDQWFDATFFKSINSERRLSAPTNAASPARAYPYRGICGFCIRVMARYARPSNSNVFMQITHAYSPRPAVLVDACQSAVFNGVYMERVGYRDHRKRTGAVGAGWDDPYLGHGVPVPAFIGELDVSSCVSGVNIQQSFGVSVVRSDGPVGSVQSSDCVFKEPQPRYTLPATTFTDDVTIRSGALRALEDARHRIGGLGLYTVHFDGGSFDTEISCPKDEEGHAVMVLVSRDANRVESASSGLYLLQLSRNSTSAPVGTLVSGSDVLRFAVSPRNMLELRATVHGAHHVVMIGNRPFET
ncbi:hypothetical protein [Paraburkholderia sp. MM5384-R2]|uniref:hypothetical protein n=1 Tax=Paraburkholderia sp. MM5384-R2 TaxID=2723097 RepID=UPI001622AB6B|nr:hypothetical protein [Paraburkholderia sp. MM5384-R2]MBB5502567.1 hypothetical protein [Paraburkholderia sp. MM5384-R2]